MATKEEKAEAKLPDTEEYRVVIAAAAYERPAITHDAEGTAKVIYVRDFGLRGSPVSLVAREAKRLTELDTGPAVRLATEPRSYDELDDKELGAEADARGLHVVSGGADPDQPRREDYINALVTFDQGTMVVHGAGTVSGGIATSSSEGVVSRIDEGTGETISTSFPPGPGEVALADLHTDALADRIKGEKLNASDTVAIANGDPALARKVLAAEQSAQGGDGRQTVVEPLQKIIDG
jgi:hypothetical protein